VWDFGGQQIYHATHQFFLTKNSFYVLVDDTRKDHKTVHDDGFKYWLEVVEVLSNASPLVILQNEKGGRSKAIDEAGIKGRFPNVRETFQANLEHKGAAEPLRKAIEEAVQRLPHIGEEVPAKWLDVRKAIEKKAKSKPYITQKDYFKLYKKHLEFDRDKALHLSQYFHDLGVFLHFQEDRRLEKTVILQNEWATEAVFKILDDEEVKQRLGRFTNADCQRLWKESTYVDMHHELLAMMEKFELCYRLADTDAEAWLSPQLLSPSQPEALADWHEPTDLVLSYRYQFLPKGMVSRLMVRMHRYVKQPDMAWTTGVLFEHEETTLLVETTDRGNEITLRAKGSEAKALLSVIASALDALNATFKGLKDKVDRWVPCNCEECQQETTPVLFEQRDLLRRKERNQPTIECKKSYQHISVLELLEGLKLDQLPMWAEEPEIQDHDLDDADAPSDPDVPAVTTPPPPSSTEKTIKIFLASSAELKDERDSFELYLRQLNDRYRKNDIYVEIIRWENFLDAMSETRLQDEYNKKVRDCDIFVSLFQTKTGKFTEEEFDVAHQAFKKNNKPLIYTFFKEAKVSTDASNRAALMSLWEFQAKLSDLGHFYTTYSSTADLQKRFRDQLDKLLDEGKL
jgi:internalin A